MINTNKNRKIAEEEVLSSPEKVSLKRLKNKAAHYLGRYASTEKKLTQVLIKFMVRRVKVMRLIQTENYMLGEATTLVNLEQVIQ